MPSSQTPNYQLNQWSRDDRILMEDFNADNAKLDVAIAGHEGRVAALEQQAPKFGNCQIWTTTYKGEGTTDKFCGKDHPCTLTFPRRPLWAIILESRGQSQLHIPPENTLYTLNDIDTCFTWNGNTLTWYSENIFKQMNWAYYTYRVFAFWPMD